MYIYGHFFLEIPILALGLNSTHSDYVTNFKYRWHVEHMQTLNCQGSDNNVFFNDSITDNMHSLAPIK